MSKQIGCIKCGYLVKNREGYKLVPVEPSEKMMDAGRIAKFETKGSLRQEYKAMIGATE